MARVDLNMGIACLGFLKVAIGVKRFPKVQNGTSRTQGQAERKVPRTFDAIAITLRPEDLRNPLMNT